MAKKAKLEPAQPLEGGTEVWADHVVQTEPVPAAAGEPGQLTTAVDVKRYVLAGKATITLKSLKTGTRYTYRVNQKTKDDGTVTPHFVSVMYGPDNTSDFLYMGAIFEGAKYRHTKNSKLQENDVRERAFCYVWDRVLDGLLPENVEVWHSGACGRCGRKLTVPESIRNGIGPECATKGKFP
jgi:Family of unknown function (DUF6011)